MSRLDSASERFHAALENLQKTATPLASSRESAEETAMRLLAITEERNRLKARVVELEQEARSLMGVSHDVEGRLDGAIAEIREALGR